MEARLLRALRLRDEGALQAELQIRHLNVDDSQRDRMYSSWKAWIISIHVKKGAATHECGEGKEQLRD